MNMTSTQTSHPPVLQEGLDLSYLHTISGGDKDFEKDMLQSLLDEMSEKMTALAAAVRADDAKSIRLQSHSLKNLAGIIGVPSLVDRFKEIEAVCEEAPNAYILQVFLPCEGQWACSKELLLQLLDAY